MSTIPAPLTLSAFAAHAGTGFAVSGLDGVSLHLSEAVPLNAAAPNESQFSLMFRGPAAPLLEQATHVLAHPAMGEFAIFLVPVARDAQGIHYQAIFS